MNHLNLKLIKEHLNLDNDFAVDDAYLSNLGDVVEQVVERHIDDSFAYLANANHGKLPTPLIQAMLLLLGTYYANREHIAFNANYEVGNSYTFLIDLYRNYSASHSDSSNYTLINSIDELMKKNKEMNDKLENIKSENSEQLETLSNTITNTNARLNDFENEFQQINSKIDNNTNEISRINGDMSSMISMVNNVESDMNTTKADLSSYQSTVDSMHGDVSELKTKVDDLNNKTLQGSDSVEVTEDGNTTTLEVNQINGGKF
jgi:DNA packaging protein, QLRG family